MTVTNASVWTPQRSSNIGRTNVTNLQLDFVLKKDLLNELQLALQSYGNGHKYLYDKKNNVVIIHSINKIDYNDLNDLKQIISDVEWKQVEYNNDWRKLTWADLE